MWEVILMEGNIQNLLTVEEMAAGLKVKKSWLYRKTMEKGPGSIPRVRLGKYVRFVEAEVMAWILKNQDTQ
jgi:excisionase family DNA binding protein